MAGFQHSAASNVVAQDGILCCLVFVTSNGTRYHLVPQTEISLNLIGTGHTDRFLTEGEVRDLMAQTFAQTDLSGKRVVIIIPDSTRTAPLPLMFRLFHEALAARVAQLDYLIALGTHMPMSEEAINKLVGVTSDERATKYKGVNVFNHAWNDPNALMTLGEISGAEISQLSGGVLTEPIPVKINKLIYFVLEEIQAVFPLLQWVELLDILTFGKMEVHKVK